MHGSLVPGDLVQRVTSLQEQLCQLDGQGPVSKLGSRGRDRLSPSSKLLSSALVLLSLPPGGHS